MDAALLPGVVIVALYTLAFLAPFVGLRLRGFAPRTRTLATLSFAAALAIGAGVFVGRDAPFIGSAPFAAGLILLGVAAAPAQGWRFVAPAAGALGLVILVGMAFGPLHPDIYPPSPKFPPPPALSMIAWTLLVAASLLLLVPWRWAGAVAAGMLWLAVFTSEPHRSFYMGAPAAMATAALISAGLPARRERSRSEDS